MVHAWFSGRVGEQLLRYLQGVNHYGSSTEKNKQQQKQTQWNNNYNKKKLNIPDSWQK